MLEDYPLFVTCPECGSTGPHEYEGSEYAGGGCGDCLADADEVDMTWRQAVDVPLVKPQVTEHQMITLACRCGHHTTADAPPEAVPPVSYGPRLAGIGVYLLHGQFLSVSRTAAALKDLFGAPVAAGTVAGWVKRSAPGDHRQGVAGDRRADRRRTGGRPCKSSRV